MKQSMIVSVLIVVVGLIVVMAGCSSGIDEITARQIAREEATNAIDNYAKSFSPEKFGFGVAWEKEWSYAQGVKAGNMIFVAGQLAHSTDVDENGMPKEDLMTGKNFEEQFRTTLDNVKAVLENYGATMDDVVFLQNFVDPVAGNNKAGDYNGPASKLIREYFPNGLHAMTFCEVSNLYGPEQLIESNAIAVINK